MMKRGVLIKLIFSFVLILFIFNTLIHISLYELGILGLSKESVSGFAVGKIPVGEKIQEGYPINAPVSRAIVIVQWVLVFVVAAGFYASSRIKLNRDCWDLRRMKKSQNRGDGTDLDVLYELLKEKKRIKFEVISKVFNIDDDLVRDWSRMLEESNLAFVDYPSFGDAELVIKVKDGK
jgi:hypothetical protein